MSGLFKDSRAWAWLFVAAMAWFGCSGSSNLVPSVPSPPEITAETTVMVGAGDIGVCGSTAAAATGRLLDDQPGTVFAAGDLAYQEGTAQQFQNCYDPVWGRHKPRTRPAPGNHEYNSAGAAPYYSYFGAIAGPSGLGYYRYVSGAWEVYALNSNVEGSAQTMWLGNELAAHPSTCSLAYFHHPRFSSGPHGLSPPEPVVSAMWDVLYKAGVDIVISAHEHFYERFAPQTPDGRTDAEFGIRQFVVGTGGAPLAVALKRVPNSEVLLTTYGILRLTLEPRSYRWEFLSADGGGVLDSGTGTCHSAR